MASNKQSNSVKDWLESLDLGHFTNNFLLNGISELHHLCSLTETELSIIGITQRGYQKRILNNLPTQAEAFLSEFVSSSKPGPDHEVPVYEPPPPTPPRRSSKQHGNENGDLVDKNINLDDETYLLHDPMVDIPMLASRRSLPGSKVIGISSKDSEPIPLLPPRTSDHQMMASEGPGKKLIAKPTPQPRVRSLPSDPSSTSQPPPLPGRDEKPERPLPKPRETPQVPPRLGHSQPASALSTPEVPMPSLAVPNVYKELEAIHLLAPPPILPNNATDEDDFPEMPPPPPPKCVPVSTAVPNPMCRNLPEDPNKGSRSSPLQHPSPSPSQQSCFQDALNPSSSAPQTAQEGLPPAPKSAPSPPSVLPDLQESSRGGSDEASLPFIFPSTHAQPSSIPVFPTRPVPPLPADSAAIRPLPVLPPREIAEHHQPPLPAGLEESSTPILPTSSAMPVIPPRPSALMQDSSTTDLPPPFPPLKDAAAHPQTSPLDGAEECTIPTLPAPFPPTASTMPVIPPRPSAVPEPSLTHLPPPLPSPEGLDSLKADQLNLFNSVKDKFDPFEFDPFESPDGTVDVYTVQPPLRPPSLFCNPEDQRQSLHLPTSLPPLPPHTEVPPQGAIPVSSSVDAPLSTLLMARPVPLPPPVRPEEPPKYETSGLASSQLPSPQNDFINPSASIQENNLPLKSTEVNNSIDDKLFQRSSGETLDISQPGLKLTENAVLTQDIVRLSPIDFGNPPVLPGRPSVGSGQANIASLTDYSPRVDSVLPNPQAPGSLPHKSSDLIDLDMYSANEFKPVGDRTEDSGSHDEPMRSALTPPLPVKDRHDIEDQYSKVYRSQKPPHEQGLSAAPQIPARPPPIPLRLDAPGEPAPSYASIARQTPTAPRDSSSISQPESRPISSSSLKVSVSPSSLSDSSDQHSYILLSESMSGTHDISDENIWPDELPSMTSMPLSSSTLDKSNERSSSSTEDALTESQLPPRPARRAPPPPLAKASEKPQPQVPKLPARPAVPQREPPNHKEDEYDVLDPHLMGRTSPLHDQPLDSPDRIAFKELAQSEESGDDDESGFEIDSFDDEKVTPKQTSDLPVGVNLADRCSKIDLSHIMRIGKSYHTPLAPTPLVRTHSRVVDESTRKRLSKKLSQSLQDRNATAEAPAKVTALKKKGYLWKQGGKQSNKGFRKRWMEFDGNEMRYYENERTLSECKGIIPVGAMRDVKNLCGASRVTFGDTKQNQITLDTTGRSFHFAAETLDEGTLWANILMQAILAYKPPPGGFPVGGDMTCPDKKGYMKIEGYQKRFFAMKGEKLCIYNTKMDFESAVAISDIQMKLASVKELAKNKIQLATPAKIYMLTVENPQDCKQWIDAMRNAIQEGLSDHSILEKIQQNPSNRYCADCGMKDPDWASINLGISICKNCSGLHRNLGVHLSKVRSLKMDTKVWTPALIQVMLDLGNDRSNAFWEANLNESEKPVPDDSLEKRQVFILSKYKDRKYCKSRPSQDKNMDKNLVKSASLGNLEECMQLIFSGANVAYTREDGKTATDVAVECQFLGVVEFFQQNVCTQVVPRSDALVKVIPKLERPSLVMRPAARESKQEIISKEGYLYRPVNNKKEFVRRYCTLKHGIFSHFEDKNLPLKDTIEGIDMVLIAVADPKPGHKYCFEIYTSVGRTCLMSAETEEDRKGWMEALAQIHSLECMWESLKDFLQAGFLHKKEGAAATNWQRVWFILKGKSVVSFSSVNDELEEIDLRKLITLSRQDSDTASATDHSHTLSIVLPGKNIYLRAETKQAADSWYEILNKVSSQGGTALEDQPLTGENVPIIVNLCIDFVATHEGTMTEGIYRLSGSSNAIRRITSAFTEDPRNARLKDDYSVHDVTGSLKKFFRELPDPLLTSALYQKWTEVASYQDHSIRLQWYQHLLGELPPVNYHTLKMLIGHLKNVADNSDFNKMYIRNLASVFGPTLMASHDSSFVHAEREIAVITDLLTYYAWLYGVTDEDLAKEREKELKYQEGLSKIRAAQASESTAEQLILMEIFMGKREKGNSINIKISMDHTAAEIVKLALEQQKMIDDGSLGLFEVIVKGELERLIHGYERVLPQVLSWNQQVAADNYICIKENELLMKIEPFIEQTSLSDLVKYSESKKTFKKYSFELMNNVITCYKDKNSSPANIWKVGDMKIYVGVEKKRCPPTQWGISFTINNEEGLKAMCLDKEASYYYWLAGLLKSKKEASNNLSETSVVDPTSLTYSPHAISFKSEHESSLARYSRNIPKELSNITSKMSFWRKSRLNSIDDS